ncbi:uncharacterized protein LOC127803061 [Diospyros lotus]|uniref:uncharacterized protein LOC127803061 n=1 Tax=Diospyros lotus TaxID=55363 RepID=UPI00225BAF5A|nr:uncharacterized protein LOC127803061 [Diospyros lotus]
MDSPEHFAPSETLLLNYLYPRIAFCKISQVSGISSCGGAEDWVVEIGKEGESRSMGMGSEPNSSPSAASGSPSAKRSRDPEDEVYLDNFHSHKRYLSEIMASSLNGLTVGDHPLPDNLMESPARSDSLFYLRDEMSLQYSPMSEDSDDLRYCETPTNNCLSQPDSRPTSPVSPYRCQRPLSGFSSVPPTTSLSHGSTVPAVTSSHPRQRGSDSEGRFPSSPSDICHSADLRRAALLRSVQMRTQPPGPSPFELPLSAGQESLHNIETEERSCAYMKSLEDERDFQIEECPSLDISEPDYKSEGSCRVSNMKIKVDEHADKAL